MYEVGKTGHRNRGAGHMIARMPGVTYMVTIGMAWFVLQTVLSKTAPKLQEMYKEMDIDLSSGSQWMFRIFGSVAKQVDQIGTTAALAIVIVGGLLVLGLLAMLAAKVRVIALIAILLFMGSALAEMWFMLAPLSHIGDSITQLG